jgi:hypothetical protein
MRLWAAMPGARLARSDNMTREECREYHGRVAARLRAAAAIRGARGCEGCYWSGRPGMRNSLAPGGSADGKQWISAAMKGSVRHRIRYLVHDPSGHSIRPPAAADHGAAAIRPDPKARTAADASTRSVAARPAAYSSSSTLRLAATQRLFNVCRRPMNALAIYNPSDATRHKNREAPDVRSF